MNVDTGYSSLSRLKQRANIDPSRGDFPKRVNIDRHRSSVIDENTERGYTWKERRFDTYQYTAHPDDTSPPSPPIPYQISLSTRDSSLQAKEKQFVPQQYIPQPGFLVSFPFPFPPPSSPSQKIIGQKHTSNSHPQTATAAILGGSASKSTTLNAPHFPPDFSAARITPSVVACSKARKSAGETSLNSRRRRGEDMAATNLWLG